MNVTNVQGNLVEGAFAFGRLKRMRKSDLWFWKRVWKLIPASALRGGLGRRIGLKLQRSTQRDAERAQSTATYFLRNRPQLEIIRQFVRSHPPGSKVDLAVLGCSKGAEVYSIAWTLGNDKADFDLRILAMDIDSDVLEFAREGVYAVLSGDLRQCSALSRRDVGAGIAEKTCRDQLSSVFERMREHELLGMFEIEGNEAKIRERFKDGITWLAGDAAADNLAGRIGLQDIVVANNFLCHLRPSTAEHCLENVMKVVKPGGLLVVSGIDLDIRERVMLKSGWHAEADTIAEVHDGDPSVLAGWPDRYWGLEPFDGKRPNWVYRYSTAFRRPEEATKVKSDVADVSREEAYLMSA